jgi:hypothetical protein
MSSALTPARGDGARYSRREDRKAMPTVTAETSDPIRPITIITAGKIPQVVKNMMALFQR